MLVPHTDGHQHGDKKLTEASVTGFCSKSVNLSLEELKNIKIILFYNTRTFQIAKFPKISNMSAHSTVMLRPRSIPVKSKLQHAWHLNFWKFFVEIPPSPGRKLFKCLTPGKIA